MQLGVFVACCRYLSFFATSRIKNMSALVEIVDVCRWKVVQRKRVSVTEIENESNII
jgi:hypothetical protein